MSSEHRAEASKCKRKGEGRTYEDEGPRQGVIVRRELAQEIAHDRGDYQRGDELCGAERVEREEGVGCGFYAVFLKRHNGGEKRKPQGDD